MSRRRIAPDRPLAAEAQRLLGNDIDAIADGLLLARENRDAGLHDARKSIKKARALLKLLRAADPDFYAAENIRLRDLARSLAHARDAAALVEAVDRLALVRPRRAKALGDLRILLEQRRDVHVIDDAALRTLIDEGLRRSAQMRRDMDRWQLPAGAEAAAAILADGVRANVRRAKRSMKRAGGRAADEDFHDLRKAVKAHWTQLGLLRDLWPTKMGKARVRLEALGERLGEHNDLAALLALLRSRELDLKRSRRTVLCKLVAREKAILAKSTLKTAHRLFDDRPKRLRRAFAEHLQAPASPAAEPPRALGAPHL
ncbi:MAG: CHAD domain-containing protein [Rhizobiaceae bacterium]|nr:CHAD domain-containing protein [Rhizobiaceae bacterium]